MQTEPPKADPPKRKRRWYSPTRDRILLGLLAAEIFVFVSDRFRWFGFNENKVRTAMCAFAIVAAAMIVILVWLAVVPLLRGRRWYQFSLRSLLMFTVICAVACAWVARRMQYKREEQAAVEATAKLGGEAWYDYQVEIGGKPNEPEWLRQIFGKSFFHEVVGAGFRNVADGDAILASLRGFTTIQTLVVWGKISDAGLSNLEGLTRIQMLDLSDSDVSDAGLRHLKGLTQLQTLSLRGTKVSDAGLEYLKGLTQLQVLMLQKTKVTYAGLSDLQKALPNCTIRYRDE